ncbi:MAG: FKBP-type peptidyl-prolyl cis-trans isomerase [Pseudomonadales bacterium]|nr:FKBP-type peptidyl-prolyl cis-trans isomerase [Halieaceae bacterium]MCP5189453.1 FKBP-type peptidyl-prolyl cis-trans isomerase [Pseudomonadales bacterium]MCP5205271.1 FKBP-type peptidyl-prolyl cis-trans isomerase [Pseudomonadales bacterium]
MKKYALPLALAGVVALQACNQQSAPAGDSAAPAASAPTAAQLETTEQRLSYGIAYTLGQRMKVDEVPMDVDAFSAGLRDAITGAEPRMTQDEISTEMQAYQERTVAEQEAAQAALAEANAAAAAAFLEENATAEGVVVTDSGLQYEILEEGDGPIPGPDDTVEVHYRGTLIDGTEFDSSYARSQTVTFGVGQVIPGWTEALQLMPVGSKWKLVIPPELGYGAGGAGQVIGPNSALIFEVDLIGIVGDDAAETEAEASAD